MARVKGNYKNTGIIQDEAGVEWITTRGAALRYDYTQNHVFKLCKRGFVTTRRWGHCLLIQLDSLEDHIRQTGQFRPVIPEGWLSLYRANSKYWLPEDKLFRLGAERVINLQVLSDNGKSKVIIDQASLEAYLKGNPNVYR